MKSIYFIFSLLLCIAISIISSCKESTPSFSLEQAFTPIDQINPDVYFATPENIAKDPNDELTAMFRKAKADDMANPEKPRPLKKEDIGPLENQSSKQPWTPIDEIFKFEKGLLDDQDWNQLSEVIKTRLVFDNPDLKVVELAIAAGAELPLHTQPTPSVFHILGGAANIQSNHITGEVAIGSSTFFDANDYRKVSVTSDVPLKVLWFSWAPQGNKSYLESGYYLTGSNIHLQPKEAIIPDTFGFWPKSEISLSGSTEMDTIRFEDASLPIENQRKILNQESREVYYPNDPRFIQESDVAWVDVLNLDPKSFFFAEDIKKLGAQLQMLRRIAKIKSVFRAKRPETGYDLNFSYLGWGPRAKYVTHSHAICEFYYVLEGDVEYIIDENKFHAVPGNFYFHPPYYDHEMRGLKDDVPFLSISGSWVPYGHRELFDQPFFLLEDVKDQSHLSFPDDFNFHNFNLDKSIKYGVL